jgi:formylglycine-generating enzyme required for sulfatase activity
MVATTRPLRRAGGCFPRSIHAITPTSTAFAADGHLPLVWGPALLVTSLSWRFGSWRRHAWRGGEPYASADDTPSRSSPTLMPWHCRWLSGRIGQLVRPPTEAEWERAARGGLEQKRFPWGDDIDASRGNFLPEPALKRHRGTRHVGSYAPNGFELYDMAGNVWHWVADWYGADAYRAGDDRNPRGPAQGAFRVLRGGSWVTHDVDQLRCAHAGRRTPHLASASVVYSGEGVPRCGSAWFPF